MRTCMSSTYVLGLISGLLIASNIQAAEPAKQPADNSWPGWLGSNRDDHSPDTGLLKQWPAGGPKLLWKADTIGQGWSSVAVVNNRAYTTGYSDGKQMLICLDMNGKIVWRSN